MNEITLTVIIEGTIYSIEEANTHLHHVLYTDCEGIRINSADELAAHPDATHFKMGFNGCAIDYGASGLLFGSGLDVQCSQIKQVVKQLIRDGNKVKLNAIGLSRGGVAALLLAKQLGDIDQFHLETNLLLLDPVPGNMRITSSLDFFNFTLANKAVDLSHSKNLKYVEALYPYLEIGDESGSRVDDILAAFHVPIRPTYPAHCKVKEEIILGAHLSAFKDLSSVDEQTHAFHGIDFIPIVRRLSKEIIYGFLGRVNALSQAAAEDNMPIILDRFMEEQEMWINWLAQVRAGLAPKDRPLHSTDGSRISATNTGLFLNKIHRDLLANTDENPDDLCLKVIPERPFIERERSPLTLEELCHFILMIQTHITATSQHNRKGQLLQTLFDNLNTENEFSQEEQSFILRDILAIALQRDRNTYSFYKQTTSGAAIVTALNNSDEYPGIKQCINPDYSPLTYSDLSKYVLGRNDLNAFGVDNKDDNLDGIEATPPGQDRYPRLIA